MGIDDRLLEFHQRVFEWFEFKYESTTAQVAELSVYLMWIFYTAKHVLAHDSAGWYAFIMAAMSFNVYYLRKIDTRIRSDRKTDTLVTLATRKHPIHVCFRVSFLGLGLFVLVGGIAAMTLDALTGIGAMFNTAAIYFLCCINDHDGSRRRQKEYEEAERTMAAEHAKW